MLASMFAPVFHIRSPEAEALEAALVWTGWVHIGGMFACVLAAIALRLRKRQRPVRVEGALERITRPLEPPPLSTAGHWVFTGIVAFTVFGSLAGQAPETLETLSTVGGARAFIAVAAWLGVFLFGSLTIVLSAHQAIRAGRAVAEAA